MTFKHLGCIHQSEKWRKNSKSKLQGILNEENKINMWKDKSGMLLEGGAVGSEKSRTPATHARASALHTLALNRHFCTSALSAKQFFFCWPMSLNSIDSSLTRDFRYVIDNYAIILDKCQQICATVSINIYKFRIF